MNFIMSKIEKPLAKMSENIAKNTVLMAIKDAFITTLPFVVISSLITVITWTIDFNLPFTNPTLTAISKFLGGISASVSAIHGLLIIVVAAYFFAESKKNVENFNKITAMLVAIASYAVITPMYVKQEGGNLVLGAISKSYLNYESTFVGLVVALCAVKMYAIFIKRLPTIKLPGSVPPAIFNSFFALIPTFVIFLIFAGLRLGVELLQYESVNAMIKAVILGPLESIGVGLFAIIIVMTLMQLLWFFGLHGFSIVWGIVGMLWVPYFLQQAETFKATGDILVFVQQPTPNAIAFIYGMIGGSGCTLGLIIALFFVSHKDSGERNIAKISLIPGLFNINEPIIFGIPIVLNPTMLIPFVFIPLINIIIAYYAHVFGFVHPLVASGSGAEPIFLNVFMLSGGKISPLVLYGALLVLDVFLWLPFAKIVSQQNGLDNRGIAKGENDGK
ncbi:MAG: PTS sugar transporter subunit IIC [Culicoidibacterales bacterium]